jgi:hypothetical protein
MYETKNPLAAMSGVFFGLLGCDQCVAGTLKGALGAHLLSLISQPLGLLFQALGFASLGR